MNSVALLLNLLQSFPHPRLIQVQRSIALQAALALLSFLHASSILILLPFHFTPSLPPFLQAITHKCLLFPLLQISAHPDKLVILKFAPALNKRMAKLIWRERYLGEAQKRESAQLLILTLLFLRFELLSQEFWGFLQNFEWKVERNSKAKGLTVLKLQNFRSSNLKFQISQLSNQLRKSSPTQSLLYVSIHSSFRQAFDVIGQEFWGIKRYLIRISHGSFSWLIDFPLWYSHHPRQIKTQTKKLCYFLVPFALQSLALLFKCSLSFDQRYFLQSNHHCFLWFFNGLWF